MSKSSSYDLVIKKQKPDFSAINPEQADYHARISDALTWINYIYTTRELKEFYLEYLKANEIEIPCIEEVDNWHFMSSGKYAHLLMNGASLSDHGKRFFKEAEVSARAEAKRIHRAKQQPKPVVKTPEQLFEIKIHTVSQRIEDLILTRTYNGAISQAVNIVREEQIPKQGIVKLIEGFKHLHREVTDTDDPDYAENIELMGERAQYTSACLADIIRQLNMELANLDSGPAKPRKPRTVKQKLATRMVRDIKHKQVDTNSNIISIDPTQIIGARQLLVYNTKNHRVGMYVAKSDETLSLRGTTLLNFDETNSTAKTLRRPDKDLIHFRTAPGAKRVEVLMGTNIRGKTFLLNGRINKDTMLLKVFK